ncbi:MULTISPECIES: signal peptide peptidase SppA [Cyanophyceae]|uniref:signal peptide peptidase SppA n=1 Tax=Cyanophyceae TaxID=3028117 RepID=UPI00232B526C|nr:MULTISPECIES: signal peptide peptidase SppA [Cyanophyceae]MDB9355511.1 signal peptide peptidase SppA [Nodularia spumigena CS-587/03]MDB9340812.1 signal peptide peptidase SppA [Nodularia spumigena CS-589/07]MDB9344221.1 signal peptide peptidase SppA [Nodularia spumigena CS-588/06]MDB9367353.1 signal peptide peptidase SppA [Nodularia spumigena CS-586/05]MDB9400399.1 signal peptide peptidase SppA [Microcystis aeruginosa CS-567/02-A1]
MRNFFKQTFASLLGTVLGLMIFFGISTTGILLLLFAVTTSRDTTPQVKDQSVVVFDLSMNITDSPPSSGELLQQALSGAEDPRMTLRSVLDTLEKARLDPRIVGIYLEATGTSASGNMGFASLTEIRQALKKFRESGKKVVAYGVGLSEKDYYLSSVADTITLNPIGLMEVNGLTSQPTFLAGALDKFGIGVQVVRVGKFKGAVEPFILKELSPENRQQIQKLLDDVWGDWQSTVSSSRKMTPQQLQAIADTQALLTATEAKSRGLVDQVAYHDEVVNDLKKLTGSDETDRTFEQINLRNYAQVPGKSLGVERNSENKIAVVYAEGEIVDGRGEDQQIGGDRFARIFNQLRQDNDVKAVVLRINSPGGSATASEIMQREVQLTREVKPVVVSMGDIAASGGYWIATDSNRIFAEPTTITGSIGVFGVLFDGQKLANDNGITWDTVKTARYADSQTPTRPKSPQELEIYQRSVTRIYNLFLDRVVQGRNLPAPKVAEIAQGRVWSGMAAKEIGLVDEIGGLNAAIEYAAKEAKLDNDWELQEYPRVSTLEERFFGRAIQEITTMLGMAGVSVQPSHPLMAELQKLQQEMVILQKMNDPHGIYTRLPFNFHIE